MRTRPVSCLGMDMVCLLEWGVYFPEMDRSITFQTSSPWGPFGLSCQKRRPHPDDNPRWDEDRQRDSWIRDIIATNDFAADLAASS